MEHAREKRYFKNVNFSIGVSSWGNRTTSPLVNGTIFPIFMPAPIMDLIQVSKLVLVKKIGWNRTPPPPSSRDQSSPTVMHLALSRKSAIIRMMMEKCEIFGLLMYRFFFFLFWLKRWGFFSWNRLTDLMLSIYTMTTVKKYINYAAMSFTFCMI